MVVLSLVIVVACAFAVACDDKECKEHSYGEWFVTAAATCTTAGSKTRECTKCHETETETISAAGHTYGTWIEEVAATCTEGGTKGHYYCNVCKKNFDADKNELGDLTITSDGHDFKNGVCENCGVYSISEGLAFNLVGEEYSVTGIGACTDTYIGNPDYS